MRTARPKHGYATRPSADNPYRAWQSMIARCTNPRNPSYSRYGGRGIAVCDRWQRFENFIADMGLRPFPGATLERNNNDGNYEPGNVVWATRKQQSRNTCATVYLTHDGITLSLAGWAERIGLSKSTLRSRLAMQWPLARALMEPLHKGKSA